jgi:hypothetical protein
MTEQQIMLHEQWFGDGDETTAEESSPSFLSWLSGTASTINNAKIKYEQEQQALDRLKNNFVNPVIVPSTSAGIDKNILLIGGGVLAVGLIIGLAK